jgi:hypothetical protein
VRVTNERKIAIKKKVATFLVFVTLFLIVVCFVFLGPKQKHKIFTFFSHFTPPPHKIIMEQQDQSVQKRQRQSDEKDEDSSTTEKKLCLHHQRLIPIIGYDTQMTLDVESCTVKMNESKIFPVVLNEKSVLSKPQNPVCLCSNATQCLYMVPESFLCDTTPSSASSPDPCALCKKNLNALCCQCLESTEEQKCKTAMVFECQHIFHVHCLAATPLDSCPTCDRNRKLLPKHKNKFTIITSVEASGVKSYDLDQWKTTKLKSLYDDLQLDPRFSALIDSKTCTYYAPSYTGTILSEGMVFAVCDVSTHSIPFELKVQFLEKSQTFNCTSKETLLELKKKIQQEFGIPVDAQVLSKVDRNVDHSLLFHLGLNSYSVLNVTTLDPPSLPLFVDLYVAGHRVCTAKKLQQAFEAKEVILGCVRFGHQKGDLPSGPQDFFTYHLSWNLPFVSQSRLGMSIFLSSLYVVFKTLNPYEEKQRKFLKWLGFVLPDQERSPCLLAWKLLLEGKISQFQNNHRTLISLSMFQLLCKFFNTQVTFSDTRVLLSSLSSAFPTDETKLFENAHIVLSYVLSNLNDTEPLPDFCAFSLTTVQKESHWKDEFPDALANMELWTVLHLEEEKQNEKEKESFKGIPKWPYVVRTYKISPYLQILDPSALSKRSFYSLTLDASGLVCVFVSTPKGKESSVTLFQPLQGTESDFTKTTLSQQVQALPSEILSLQTSLVSVSDEYNQDVGIMVCMDVSSSMTESSGFDSSNDSKDKSTKIEKEEDNDDDEEVELNWKVTEERFPLVNSNDLTLINKRVRLDQDVEIFLHHPNFQGLVYMTKRLQNNSPFVSKRNVALKVLFFFTTRFLQNARLGTTIKTYRSIFADLLLGRKYVDMRDQTLTPEYFSFPGLMLSFFHENCVCVCC